MADNDGRRVAQNNLAVRLTTAAIVAPLLLLTMFFAPPWAWYLIVLVASVLGAYELFGMTHPHEAGARWLGVATTAALSAALYFYTHDVRVLLTVILMVPVVGVLVPLWQLGQMETAAFRLLSGIAGPFYVGGLLTTIALIHRDMGAVGPHYVVMTLMFAWLGDTGGYFAGRAFGRVKLYEAVSPKKTREGFIGSLGGSVAGALLAHFWYLPEIPLLDAIVLAVVGGALGQLGDLSESVLKRSMGVKDSGQLVPGHGGILDRIDALLVTSPVVYLYTLWAKPGL